MEASIWLRDVVEQDLEQILNWRNSDRIRAQMYTDEPITMENHLKWFSKASKDEQVSLKIFEFEGVPAGFVHITYRDRRNGIAHWGFYLGRDDLPKGTGSQMGSLALHHAFEVMGVRKLIGEAFAFNTASIRLHEKLGFRQEGIYRNHILKNGRYEDIVCFARFQDEYRTGETGHE